MLCQTGTRASALRASTNTHTDRNQCAINTSCCRHFCCLMAECFAGSTAGWMLFSVASQPGSTHANSHRQLAHTRHKVDTPRQVCLRCTIVAGMFCCSFVVWLNVCDCRFAPPNAQLAPRVPKQMDPLRYTEQQHIDRCFILAFFYGGCRSIAQGLDETYLPRLGVEQ